MVRTVRVRALINDKGQEIQRPVRPCRWKVLGLDLPPEAGDEFAAVENENRPATLPNTAAKEKEARLARFAKSGRSAVRDRGGPAPRNSRSSSSRTCGSAEAIVGSVNKFNGDEVKCRVIHSGVAGAINESGRDARAATGALIIAFNVRPTPKAGNLLRPEGRDPLLLGHL